MALGATTRMRDLSLSSTSLTPSLGGDSAVLPPLMMCRVSALPTTVVDTLRSAECIDLLARLAALHAAAAQRRDRASDLLFAAVGGMDDRQARQRLIRLRRDLFNSRAVDRAALTQAATSLTGDSAATVTDFNELLLERRDVEALLERAYARAIEEGRASLARALDSEPLRRGILASSDSLYAALESYRRDPGRLRTGARLRVERGLLRYLTRAAMKSTPFATLCTVLPAELADGSVGPIAAGRSGIIGPAAQTTTARLNKGLYGALVGSLRKSEVIRPYLLVELNPTLSTEADGVVFLSVRDGRESFVRMPENPVLDLVREALAEPRRTSFGSLAASLAAHPMLESTEEEVAGLLNHLLDAGFLRVAFGVAEQDAEWDGPLVRLLEPIPEASMQALTAALRRLRVAADEYAQTESHGRVDVLARARTAGADALEAVGRARVFSPLIVLEDASAEARAVVVRDPELDALIDDVTAYITLTREMASVRIEQAIVRHFFDTYYGAGVEDVPLLRFYEDFYREHQKGHLERAESLRAGAAPDPSYNMNNPFGLAEVSAVQGARQRLAALMAERCLASPNAEEIQVTRDDLAGIVSTLPKLPADPSSVELFAAYAPRDARGNPPRFVIHGNYVEGFGKFFSRFLHLLPVDVTEALQERNAAWTELVLAEICGDSNFNANLHPPLMPFELSYPTGESGDSASQIPTGDVVVRRHGDDVHALALQHAPSGRRILPVDLGFQARDMRPALYQLLGSFTPPSRFTPHTPDYVDVSDGVRHRPRIVFGTGLVLARRAWFVASAAIPRREPQEAAHLYYARLDRWRREAGIPAEGYLRIRPKPSARSAQSADRVAADSRLPLDDADAHAGEDAAEGQREGEELDGAAPAVAEQGGNTADAAAQPRKTAWEAGRGTRNLAKPQYYDFGAPFLLPLIEHAFGELPEFVAVFEERLPDRDGLPVWNGEPHAAELVLQLDFPPGAAAP